MPSNYKWQRQQRSYSYVMIYGQSGLLIKHARRADDVYALWCQPEWQIVWFEHTEWAPAEFSSEPCAVVVAPWSRLLCFSPFIIYLVLI